MADEVISPEEMRPIEDLLNTGVLWAINRYVFHPRGLAFALHIDEGEVVGWSLQGEGVEGKEVWSYHPETDDAKFVEFEEFLAEYGGS